MFVDIVVSQMLPVFRRLTMMHKSIISPIHNPDGRPPDPGVQQPPELASHSGFFAQLPLSQIMQSPQA